MESQQDILDHISTGVLALDAGLHVLIMNAAGEALLETSRERSLGQHAGKLVVNSREHWLHNLEQVLASGSPLVRRGVPLALHSGQEIHVDLMVTPVLSSNSGIAVVAELQPVDRLLRISREEHIIQSQETTQVIVRGLAHEIKNPLGGVRGAAQLLARELGDEGLKEYTNIIIREADRLRDLVDRLLGPRQQPELRPLNIHEVLEHVRNLINAEAGNRATVTRDYDPSLPEIAGDRAQLIQAVLNILRNALQAATDGTAELVIRTRSQRQFTIGAQRHRLVVRVDIEDNGPGIPPELLPSIFVPMVTGRVDGSGLGLTIAQSIVNRHGGLLECESEPGRTVFSIYLPMDSDNV